MEIKSFVSINFLSSNTLSINVVEGGVDCGCTGNGDQWVSVARFFCI